MRNAKPSTAQRVDDEDFLNGHLLGMHAEGQGAWIISFYDAELLAHYIATNAKVPQARKALEFFRLTAEMVVQAPPDCPVTCLTCNYGFRMVPGDAPAVLVLLEPYGATSGNGIGQALCRQCYEKFDSFDAMTAHVSKAVMAQCGLDNARLVDRHAMSGTTGHG